LNAPFPRFTGFVAKGAQATPDRRIWRRPRIDAAFPGVVCGLQTGHAHYRVPRFHAKLAALRLAEKVNPQSKVYDDRWPTRDRERRLTRRKTPRKQFSRIRVNWERKNGRKKPECCDCDRRSRRVARPMLTPASVEASRTKDRPSFSVKKFLPGIDHPAIAV